MTTDPEPTTIDTPAGSWAVCVRCRHLADAGGDAQRVDGEGWVCSACSECGGP